MGFCSLQLLPSYTLSFCMFKIQKTPRNIQEKHLLQYDYPRSHLASFLIFTEASSELSNSDLQVKALLPWLLLKSLAPSASSIISWPPLYSQALNPASATPIQFGEPHSCSPPWQRICLPDPNPDPFLSQKTTLHVAHSTSH